MKSSEQVTKIFPAFIKAQSEFAKATKDSNNPFFKSKYADLNSYLDAISDALTDNDLAVMQDTSGADQGQIIKVATRLIHSSGEWIESEPLVLHPTDMKPQSFGSAQTYARRYSLASFLGLGAEDDDGNHASKKPKPPKRSDINKHLATFTDLKEFQAYAKTFPSANHISWADSSGKQGGKETWGQLFEMHSKRIKGENPIDTSKTPEQTIGEFEQLLNNCSDLPTLDILKAQLDAEKCLYDNREKYEKIMDEIYEELS